MRVSATGSKGAERAARSTTLAATARAPDSTAGSESVRRRWLAGRSGLAPLCPPPFDDAGDHLFLIAGLPPQLGEERVGRGRPEVALEVVERDADRDRHALAANDALAVAQGRDRVEEPARALGHRRLDEGLVAIVVEAHRDDRAALREDALGEIGRALRDQPERDAIF